MRIECNRRESASERVIEANEKGNLPNLLNTLVGMPKNEAYVYWLEQ